MSCVSSRCSKQAARWPLFVLRELLSAMATVAFQTVGSYRSYQRRQKGEPMSASATPSHAMGKCLAWDFDGPLIARIAPQFRGYKLPAKG